MSKLRTLQRAMTKAVDLLNEIGTPCTYTDKATATAVSVNAVIRELSSLELVGDYRQGDLKVELDATKLSAKPLKYDTLDVQGKVYAVMSPSGAERRLGDTVYTYKFVVRGA